ncbi:MAG: AraC family transcriptional regulator [Eubacteriales bacterium]|nr:AraC family transcriptional regulator [Eubacteriales bacterium]
MEKILTPTNYELIPLDGRTNVRFYTSIDSGSYVAPHWHDAVEILYMLEGELKIRMEKVSFTLESGRCILINPNQVHSTLCTRPNRAIVFQIPESFLEKWIPDKQALNFTLKDPADTVDQQSKVNGFKEILAHMRLLEEEQPDSGVLKFNSLLFEALFQLCQNFRAPIAPEEMTRREKNLEKLKPVLDYIAENYNRPIPLQEIAQVAAFEPKYFCRFFKKWMGMTFLEYQNEVRLGKIYEEVLGTEERISDLLEKHGFTNEKVFRRMFRERFGATPTQLRGPHPERSY